METEAILAILVSFASLLFGVYSGMSSIRRATRAEQRREASELTMVIVKLEDISAGVGEIKSDISNVKHDVKDLTGRLIIAEQQIAEANKKINDLQRR